MIEYIHKDAIKRFLKAYGCGVKMKDAVKGAKIGEDVYSLDMVARNVAVKLQNVQ